MVPGADRVGVELAADELILLLGACCQDGCRESEGCGVLNDKPLRGVDDESGRGMLDPTCAEGDDGCIERRLDSGGR